MQALEKLTLAYLELREHAQKLQSAINATQYDLAELQAKYKTVKEQKQFLQDERDKLTAQKENYICEHADEIRNLKQCIEELESQLVALTPKEQRIDEPTDGYEAAKRVCRADFKASETTEKADEAIQPVILLQNTNGEYVKSKFNYVADCKNGTISKVKLLYTPNKEEAQRFANLAEVGAYCIGCVGEKLQTSYHHPETLQLIPIEI